MRQVRMWLARALPAVLASAALSVAASTAVAPPAVAATGPCDIIGDTRPRPILGNGCPIPVQSPEMAAFELKAIDDVLRSHGLPVTNAERDKVRSWARDDVRAHEWITLTNIIRKRKADRTPVEQRMYEGFSQAYTSHKIAGAEAGVEEYQQWAGLNYDNIHDDPTNFNAGNSGYCNYVPPTGERDGWFTYKYNPNQLCFTRCTNFAGCDPTYPSSKDFVRWGYHRTLDAKIANTDFTNSMLGTYGAIAMASALAGTAAAVPIAAAIGASTSALAGTAIQTTLFPYAARALYLSLAQTTAAESAAATASAEASASALTASGVTFGVGVAIFAAVTITMESIERAENAQVSQDLLDAADFWKNLPFPNKVYPLDYYFPTDPSSSQQSQRFYQDAFAVFMAGTLPDVNYDCETASATKSCANAPIPDSFNPATDPVFEYFRTGPTGVVTSTVETTIYTKSPSFAANALVSMTGNGWFRTTKYDPNLPANAGGPVTPGRTIQSLQFRYRDWNSKVWVASRILDNQGKPKFAAVPADSEDGNACRTSVPGVSPCVTDRIQYLEADGTKATAVIIPASALPPLITTQVPARTSAGSPTKLVAVAHPRAGWVAPFTYSWEVGGYFFPGTHTFFGPTVDAAGQFLGTWPITLRVNDSDGHTTTQTFSIRAEGTTRLTITPSVSSPLVLGQPVTFTALVYAGEYVGACVGALIADCKSPTGRVQFYVDGNAVGAPVPLLGGVVPGCSGICASRSYGTATSEPISDLTVTDGTTARHVVTALYEGDAVFFGSSGELGELEVYRQSPNFSWSMEQYPKGSWDTPIRFSARVWKLDGFPHDPTGGVRFSVNGVPVGEPQRLGPDGTVTVFGVIPEGTSHSIKVYYSGDANYSGRIAGRETFPNTPSVPSVIDAQLPSAINQPFRLTFDRDVRQINRTTVFLTDMITNKKVATKLTCLSGTGAPVSCRRGPVLEVIVVPRADLKFLHQYVLQVTSGVVDFSSGEAAQPYETTYPGAAEVSALEYPVSYAWPMVLDTAALGKSYIQERSAGADVSWTSTASSVGVVTRTGPDGGMGSFSVRTHDDETGTLSIGKRVFDTYSPTPGSMTTTISGLPPGTHSVSVSVSANKNTLSSDTLVRVDAVVNGATTTRTPKLTATWPVSGPGVAYTTLPGGTVTFPFYGTGTSFLYGTDGVDLTVTIDNQPVQPTSIVPTEGGWVRRVYDGLEPGKHTLKITSNVSPGDVIAVQTFGVL